MPILFFIYLEKIANIRKYIKNDEYFPHSELVLSAQFSHGLEGHVALLVIL